MTVETNKKASLELQEPDDSQNVFESKNLEICKEFSFSVEILYENDPEIIEEESDKVEIEKPQRKQQSEVEDEWYNSPIPEEVKKDDHVIFAYFNVMKRLVTSVDRLFVTQNKPSGSLEKLEKLENPEKKDFHDLISKGLKGSIILVLIIFNYFLIYSEMFLRTFAFIALSNDTKKSLMSQNVVTLSLCLKRWYY